jgi:D-amino acid aminotransferase
MMKVFLNDKLVDAKKASVSVSDGGFLYGAGLFETMRGCNGVVFRLSDHLARLLTSAKALSMEHGFDEASLTDAVYKVLEANELNDARVRLTLSAGSVSPSGDKPTATLLVSAGQFQAYPAAYYKKGVLAVLCPFRQNISDPTCGHKVTSYFSRMIALRQAHEKRAAEAIWFTTDGRLAEGCVSNVFLVKDGRLLTPKAQTPVLPGVARKTVIELAAEHAINVDEKDLTIDDMLGADEVFLTNVIMQVMPVAAIEKHAVGKGKPGPVTEKLIAAYSEFLKRHCEKR